MSTETPLAAVNQYIDAFNRGDADTMTATFAVPGQILDGMAPHVWQGPTATADWYRDALIETKEHGASSLFVTIGDPLHNETTKDSGYVVLPATFTYDLKDRKVVQTGAFFTFALRKTVDGWRITAWAWTKGTFQ